MPNHAPPFTGKMSAHELVSHLTDAVVGLHNKQAAVCILHELYVKTSNRRDIPLKETIALAMIATHPGKAKVLLGDDTFDYYQNR